MASNALEPQRIKLLETALMRLKESLELIHQPHATMFYRQIRDSIIQSLTFCFDLFWKCIKDFLEIHHGIVVASPKSSFKEAVAIGLVNEDEYNMLIGLLNDRNDSSHRYDEEMAEVISKKTQQYYNLMITIMHRLLATTYST